MKTLTEFQGIWLKNALNHREELKKAGKTPEEIPVALGEILKLEGDRLAALMATFEAVGAKLDGLKRVVVLMLAENEVAPKGAHTQGAFQLVVEHYQAPGRAPQPGSGDSRPGRGDKRGGKRGGDGGRRGGRGGPGGDRGDKPPARP